MPCLPCKVPRRLTAIKRATRPSPVPEVPRLPRKTKVDVAKCRACHKVTVDVAKYHACHAKCRVAPGDQQGPSAPPEPAQCHKCHLCHAKRSCHAKRATRASPVLEVPRLPRRTQVDVAKYHACHVKRRARCRQVPHLPCKVRRRHGRLTATKRATRPNPVPEVPRLPCRTQVVVAKCHACHVKRRKSLSPSATLATQSAAVSRGTNGDQARHQTQPSAASATPATQNEDGCPEVPRLPGKVKVDV